MKLRVLKNDYSTCIKGIVGINKPKRLHFDFETDLDVKTDDMVWFVWVEYSTGSTFGQAENNISYIDIFKTEDEAIACSDAIKQSYADYKDNVRNHNHSYQMSYVNDGQTKQTSTSWCGYFEDLVYVSVQEFRIQKHNKRNSPQDY